MGYASHRVASKLTDVGTPPLLPERQLPQTSNPMEVVDQTPWNEQNALLDTRLALPAYTLQLGLNLAFSPLFFGLQQLGWAALDICACFAASAWTSVLFYKVSSLLLKFINTRFNFEITIDFCLKKIDKVAGWSMAAYSALMGYACFSFGYIWYFNRKRKSNHEEEDD
jgi:tryptophan-rich sensory protein